jgi:hypothetical protein
MRRLFAVLVFASLAACDTLSGPLESTVGGTWTGTSAGQSLTMNLQQGGSGVAGTGALTGSFGARNVAISGNFTPPDLTLTLSSAGAPPITLEAVVTNNALLGSLTGGGFTGDAIAMSRQ